ncbi:MAG: hypothetical protein ACLFUM_07215, partial [Spirochaetaceae bacterium]
LGWFDELLAPALLPEAGIFNPRAVGVLLEKCRRNNGIGMSNGDNMRLVAITSTMLLHEQFVKHPTRPQAEAVETVAIRTEAA